MVPVICLNSGNLLQFTFFDRVKIEEKCVEEGVKKQAKWCDVIYEGRSLSGQTRAQILQILRIMLIF